MLCEQLTSPVHPLLQIQHTWLSGWFLPRRRWDLAKFTVVLPLDFCTCEIQIIIPAASASWCYQEDKKGDSCAAEMLQKNLRILKHI